MPNDREIAEIEAILRKHLMPKESNGFPYVAGVSQAAAAIAALRARDREDGAREMRERESLPPRLAVALAELGRHEAAQRNAVYWWRRTSMDKLVALGLVETWRPKSLEHSTRKDLPYRLTEAGRAALTSQETSDGR